MKNKLIWIPGLLLIGAAVVVAAFRTRETTEIYRTVAIERGTIEEVVSATGSLQATETVEVGTQVSGQVAEILVDFNHHVRKGQLLARIDATILSNEVRAAEATVARAQAELDKAERELARNKTLHEQKIITDSEFEQAQYARSVAAASHTSAAVSLERARRNVGYTEIRAPIDGIVVERSVDVGQTVAASTSAPKLFVIAQDLSQMQILASVDESDIGRIKQGQDVRFTVQAYGDREFQGTVEQVRLQSTAQDNVVSYGVVVDVQNPEGALLPGMTATVEFLVTRAENVLKVANAALRFQPTEAMRAQMAARRAVDAGADVDAGTANRGPRVNVTARSNIAGRPNGTRPVMLWHKDANGELITIRVRTGITDGQYTEVSGDGLEESLEVIAGVTTGGQPAAAANPFQAQQQQQRGPGGPPRSF